MSQEQKQATKQILKELYRERINPLEATEQIDSAIGGITGVNLREGLTITNHRDSIPINRQGLGRKEYEKLNELATLCYWKAQRNGIPFPGEVHLGKGVSSKHYKPGFTAYQNGLLAKYQSPTERRPEYGTARN